MTLPRLTYTLVAFFIFSAASTSLVASDAPGSNHPSISEASASILVNSHLDSNVAGDGKCTLREAVNNANLNVDTSGGDCVAGSGSDVIRFGFNKDSTLTLSATLPDITDPVTIDGSVAGCSGPCIVIRGGENINGLHIATTNSTLRGLVLNGFDQYAVKITDDDNFIQGNYIGTARDGSSSGDNSDDGIFVLGGADNLIGGSSANDRNIISGNAVAGIRISGTTSVNNRIQGNYIGVDVTGKKRLGNGTGVLIENLAKNNIIGGTNEFERNIISGNNNDGIEITGNLTNGNVVIGNYVGIDVSGNRFDGSNTIGISIRSQANSNIIGGTQPGAGNVISGNGSIGVNIQSDNNTIEGNIIGTGPDGSILPGQQFGLSIFNDAQNNTIGGFQTAARNIISSNVTGILLSGNGTDNNTVQGNYIGTDLTGTTARPNIIGVRITAEAENNLIGGTQTGTSNVISANSSRGIEVSGSGTNLNKIQGNLIGTTATGTGALGNLIGILIQNGASDNTIGATQGAQRNVISGNGLRGIVISDSGTDNNSVYGNYIGTNASGDAALPNFLGIQIASGASRTKVGGNEPAMRNVISGNANEGISISDVLVETKILGNYIGTNAAGDASVPNISHGIEILNQVTSLLIGSTEAGSGNLISGNGKHGILLNASEFVGVYNNLIGTDRQGLFDLGNGMHGISIEKSTHFIGSFNAGNTIAFNAGDGISVTISAGESSSENLILSNFIYANDGLGIDLNDDGVTTNDPLDPDDGPNHYQNFPVLTSAVAGSTTINWTLDSKPDSKFYLEFYSNSTPDPSNHGEGSLLLGGDTVMTDLTGTTAGSFYTELTKEPGHWVSALATLITDSTAHGTSEFSAAIQVTDPTGITVYTAVADGDWDTSSTWDQPGTPGANDEARITGDYTVIVRGDTTIAVDKLTLGNTSGSASTLNLNGELRVFDLFEQKSTGTLNIGTGGALKINDGSNSGGTVNFNGNSSIAPIISGEGNGLSISGDLNVTGTNDPNSISVKLDTNGNLTIDIQEGKSLNIENNVDINHPTTVDGGGTMTIVGDLNRADGVTIDQSGTGIKTTVHVTGTWTDNTSEDVTGGFDGPGTAKVSGTFNSTNAGENGWSVNVDGTGSNWNVENGEMPLTGGGDFRDANVTVAPGATLGTHNNDFQFGNTEINGAGTWDTFGANLDADNPVDVNASAQLGTSGTFTGGPWNFWGQVDITAAMTFDDGTFNFNGVTDFSHTGSVNIEDGAVVTNNGTMNNSGGGIGLGGEFNNNGTLNWNTTADVNPIFADIGLWKNLAGQIQFDANGQMALNDVLVESQNGAWNVIQGELFMDGAGNTFSGDQIQIGQAATINVFGGSLSMADFEIIVDGFFDADGNGGSSVDFQEGNFNGSGIIDSGDFEIFKSEFNAGTTPAQSSSKQSSGNKTNTVELGTLTLVGDPDFGTSTVNLEIAGLTPDTQHDVLAITGNPTLTGGTLNVTLAPGFTPTVGDRFTVITCSSGCTGTFGTENLPDGFVADYSDPNEVTVEVSSTPTAGLSLKIWLAGPYNGSDMSTELFTNTLLPVNQPYNTPPWNYAGAETLPSPPSTMVDWVLLRLREEAEGPALDSRAAILHNDGTITDLAGGPVLFSNVSPGPFFVVVEHRNHLAVMTKDPVTLSSAPVLTDLTSGPVQVFGDDLQDLGDGRFGLYGGDSNADGSVVYIGAVRDQLTIINVLGTSNLADTATGYEQADMTLDGQVIYIGALRDQLPILTSLGIENLAGQKQTMVPNWNAPSTLAKRSDPE